MPGYASLEDVKRIMRVTDSSADDALRVALAVAEAWLDHRVENIWRDGLLCKTYYDIPEDATLRLPAKDATVVEVKVFEYPSAYGIPLSPIQLGLGHGYDLTESGDLILRPTLTVTPFEGASAQRRLRSYSRVEVYYRGSGVIPKDLTEGVAILAAGHYRDTPRALKGLASENIGDYAYTTSAGCDPEFMERALLFLKPYLRRSRVTVI